MPVPLPRTSFAFHGRCRTLQPRIHRMSTAGQLCGRFQPRARNLVDKAVVPHGECRLLWSCPKGPLERSSGAGSDLCTAVASQRRGLTAPALSAPARTRQVEIASRSATFCPCPAPSSSFGRFRVCHGDGVRLGPWQDSQSRDRNPSTPTSGPPLSAGFSLQFRCPTRFGYSWPISWRGSGARMLINESPALAGHHEGRAGSASKLCI